MAAEGAARACGNLIDIRAWPHEIEKLLQTADAADQSGNLSVIFSPVVGGDAPSPSGGTKLRAFRALSHRQRPPVLNPEAWRNQRDADVVQIAKMWRSLVAPNGDADWKSIIAVLKAGSAKRSFGALTRGNPSTPPDIRAIGRGHAALLLALERGRSLLSRVKLRLAADACMDRETECDLSSPLARPRSFLTAAERATYLAEGKEKLQEQDAKAREAYEQMTPASQRAADEAREKADRGWRKAVAEARQKTVAEAFKDATARGAAKDVRRKAYEELLQCATSDSVAACFQAVAAESTEQLAAALDGAVDRHNDAAHEDDVLDKDDAEKVLTRDPKEEYQQSIKNRAAPTRLLGLQSEPSLARLFNIVVDILIPLELFEAAAKASRAFDERRGVAGKSRFGFLTAAIESCGGDRCVWTTCKVRLQDDGASAPHIWSCTRVEMDLFATLSDNAADRKSRDDLIANGALAQIDGVVHIAASRKNGEVREPRFDIISLDATQAVENRQTSKTTTHAPLDGKKDGASQKPEARPLVTFVAGLALVDRWREVSALTQALRRFSRAKTQPTTPSSTPTTLRSATAWMSLSGPKEKTLSGARCATGGSNSATTRSLKRC